METWNLPLHCTLYCPTSIRFLFTIKNGYVVNKHQSCVYLNVKKICTFFGENSNKALSWFIMEKIFKTLFQKKEK
jgi:hypothetical protein